MAGIAFALFVFGMIRSTTATSSAKAITRRGSALTVAEVDSNGEVERVRMARDTSQPRVHRGLTRKAVKADQYEGADGAGGGTLRGGGNDRMEQSSVNFDGEREADAIIQRFAAMEELDQRWWGDVKSKWETATSKVKSALKKYAKSTHSKPGNSDTAPAGVGPKIIFDGSGTMATKIHTMPGQFASEFLFSMDKVKNNITVNASHVVMPMNGRIQAMYIRRMNGAEDEEIGVVVQRYTENSDKIMKSRVADDIKIMVAEKMHVFSKKKLDTTAYDRAVQRQREDDDTKWWKKNSTYYRNLYTTAVAAVAQPIIKLWELAGAPNAAIQNWSSDGGDAPANMYTRADVLRTAMTANFTEMRAAGRDFSDPLLSSVNCFHFGAGATFDIEKEQVILPLKQKLSTYRGHTVSAPFMSMGLLQRTSFWNYREDLGTVEVYFGSSLQVVLGDPYEENPEGAIYASAMDGVGDAVALPSWSDQETDALGKLAHGLLHIRDVKYVMNWGFLFQDPDILCPPEHQQKFGGWLDELEENHGGMTLTSREALLRGGAQALLKTAEAWLNLLKCVTTYAKPDHTNAAEYGIYMSNALLHGLMEVPRRYVLTCLGARDWNDIDLNLIEGGASA
jgi:hypothetical protein